MGIIKVNSSSKLNKFFSDKVAVLSEGLGVDFHMARNIVRWKQANSHTSNMGLKKTTKIPIGLTSEQLESPSAKLVRQIQNGTGTALAMTRVAAPFSFSVPPDTTWDEAVEYGMTLMKNGTLLTGPQVLEEVKQVLIEQDVIRGMETA